MLAPGYAPGILIGSLNYPGYALSVSSASHISQSERGVITIITLGSDVSGRWSETRTSNIEREQGLYHTIYIVLGTHLF